VVHKKAAFFWPLFYFYSVVNMKKGSAMDPKFYLTRLLLWRERSNKKRRSLKDRRSDTDGKEDREDYYFFPDLSPKR
jgi:hypothetical protein